MKNKACLPCLLVEPISSRVKGEVKPHVVNDGETDFLETSSAEAKSSCSPCCTVNLSPQCRTLHKPTICPAAMCVFNSIQFHWEFVALAYLASCCFPFRQHSKRIFPPCSLFFAFLWIWNSQHLERNEGRSNFWVSLLLFFFFQQVPGDCHTWITVFRSELLV